MKDCLPSYSIYIFHISATCSLIMSPVTWSCFTLYLPQSSINQFLPPPSSSFLLAGAGAGLGGRGRGHWANLFTLGRRSFSVGQFLCGFSIFNCSTIFSSFQPFLTIFSHFQPFSDIFNHSIQLLNVFTCFQPFQT